MAAPLTGLFAAAFTPMHADTSLNLDLVEPYARHLEASGVAGVFVAGTTGEAASLSFQERRDLATRWITVPGLPLKLAGCRLARSTRREQS